MQLLHCHVYVSCNLQVVLCNLKIMYAQFVNRDLTLTLNPTITVTLTLTSAIAACSTTCKLRSSTNCVQHIPVEVICLDLSQHILVGSGWDMHDFAALAQNMRLEFHQSIHWFKCFS